MKLHWYEIAWEWNCMGMKLHGYEIALVWNCMRMKLHENEIAWVWNCMRMKLHWYEMKLHENEIALVWNCMRMKLLDYEIAWLWNCMGMKLHENEIAWVLNCTSLKLHFMRFITTLQVLLVSSNVILSALMWSVMGSTCARPAHAHMASIAATKEWHTSHLKCTVTNFCRSSKFMRSLAEG